MTDRVELVARAIDEVTLEYDSRDTLAEHIRKLRLVQARAAIAAADGPNSVQVRDQMLCERYGSQRPRAQWDVT